MLFIDKHPIQKVYKDTSLFKSWPETSTLHNMFATDMQRAKKAVSYSTWDWWILLSDKWIFFEVFWGRIQMKDAL